MKSLMHTEYNQTSSAGLTSSEENCHFPRLRGLRVGLAVLIFSWLVTPTADAAFYSDSISLTTARGSHTATLLPDGRVLVAGGQTNGGFSLSLAEVYNP